jgi:TetR/AcrR family fatty acid metabolism transcriptional regulator
MSVHSYWIMQKTAKNVAATRPAVADKREAILRARGKGICATGLFQLEGLRHRGEAGIADGTVYLYFKSKTRSSTRSSIRRWSGLSVRAEPNSQNSHRLSTSCRKIAELHLARLGGDRDLAVVFQVELRGSRRNSCGSFLAADFTIISK